jgi:MoxR-like ATPase
MPSHKEFAQIIKRTGGTTEPEIKVVATGEDMIKMGRIVRHIPIDETVLNYLIHVVRLTHPSVAQAPEAVKKYVRHGASPRAAQAILAAARVRAMLAGRYHVARDDINAVAVPAMRHRLILSFEGEAEGMTADTLIQNIVTRTSVARSA